MNPVPDTAQVGAADQVLTPIEVTTFVRDQLGRLDIDGRSVCVIVPDATRSCPLALLMRALHSALHDRVSRLTVVVALGTHAAMSEAELTRHLGAPPDSFADTTVVNHAWWDDAALVSLGTVTAERLSELSDGRLHRDVDVVVNRAVVEHDVSLVVGPVFPHEVVGFSGGNKYFVPGVAGPEIIDVSHWLGALITSATIIGTTGTTPVRALIDEAAAMIPGRRLALCMVVESGSDKLHHVSFGAPEDAWSSAAAVSARTHVRYLDRPVRQVLAVIPPKYPDLWTGAKGFYKVEPVVADGGEVILYAPHITEIATTHPGILEIGYHCRDYFMKQWDQFSDRHWGELAHSTHLRGAGTWDPATGEHDRVTVTLATGVPEAVTRSVNLDYRDPAGIDLAAFAARAATDADLLFLPQAGEVLYRLRS